MVPHALLFNILSLARSSAFRNGLAEKGHEFAITGTTRLTSRLIKIRFIVYILVPSEAGVCAQVFLRTDLVSGLCLVLDYL
jgi:hypothetical protein